MRSRFVLLAGVCLTIVLAYAVSPLISAYALSRKVAAKDAPAVNEQIDYQRLRRSIAGQVTTAYFAISDRGKSLNPLLRNLATGIGGGIAERYLTEILTPDAMAELLQGTAQTFPGTETSLRFSSLTDVFRSGLGTALRDSYFSNPITYILQMPNGIGISFRYAGLGWQVAGIELTRDMAESLAREVLKREKATS